MLKFQVGDVLSFYPRNMSIGFYRPISEGKEGREKDIQDIFKKTSFIKDDSSFQEFMVWLINVFEIRLKETKVLSCNLAYEITSVPE